MSAERHPTADTPPDPGVRQRSADAPAKAAERDDYVPPGLLADLAGLAADELLAGGVVSADRARHLGHAIAARVARIYGGEQVYVPKGSWNQSTLLWTERWERDLAIYRAYDGANCDAVCKRYQVGRSRLYKIISRVAEQLARPHSMPSALPSIPENVARPPVGMPTPRPRSPGPTPAPRTADLFGD